MPVVTITEAAKLVKKTRQTLYSHNKKGKVSFARMADGSPGIDTLELERVYGKLHVTPEQLDKLSTDSVNVKSDKNRQPLTVKKDSIDNDLRVEVEVLRSKLADLENSSQKQERLLSDQVEDLRQRLDASEKERREKSSEVKLLTDQRIQSLDEQPQPGFFKKLFGAG